MQIDRRLIGAVTLGLALAMTSLTGQAASAAGGPPSIISISPNPVAASGVVGVAGAGCDASSPVSLRLTNTIGGDPLQVDSATTAGGAGTFSVDIPLAGHFEPGSEVAVRASCTAVFDESVGSDVEGDNSYFAVTLDDPMVSVTVAPKAAYGSRPSVVVENDRVPGQLFIYLDETLVHQDGSALGGLTYRLPRVVPIGSYTVRVEFDPAAPGAPTVEDAASLRIVKAMSRVKLKATPKKVAPGKRVKLKVKISSTGRRTGKVELYDGSRKVGTVRLKPGDRGKAKKKIRLRGVGGHRLKAAYRGDGTTKKASSARIRVKVV